LIDPTLKQESQSVFAGWDFFLTRFFVGCFSLLLPTAGQNVHRVAFDLTSGTIAYLAQEKESIKQPIRWVVELDTANYHTYSIRGEKPRDF